MTKLQRILKNINSQMNTYIRRGPEHGSSVLVEPGAQHSGRCMEGFWFPNKEALQVVGVGERATMSCSPGFYGGFTEYDLPLLSPPQRWRGKGVRLEVSNL